MIDPRYPIGPLEVPGRFSSPARRAAVTAIGALPGQLRAAVADLDDAQLDTPYRDGGWTVRQVVHHLVDSHLNAFIRTKLTLTEQSPTIRPYDERAWAELPDSALPVAASLATLDLLHARWVVLLDACADEAAARTLVHPERGALTFDDLLATYAWHGRHHTAHVTSLRAARGW